jgi:hypothetical protein
MENPWKTLDQLGLRGRTPLWYYILLEAEIEERGLRLGTIGSRLVIEVLQGALWADQNSYLRNTKPGWTPPEWSTPKGERLAVKHLSDIPIVVGLTASTI